jgi:hypothetical protein
MKIDLKKQTAVITLNSDGSMIANRKPEVITSEMFSFAIDKYREENPDHLQLESFGLFESSTPNYTTYYPDVKPEDLLPKDEEFIYPIFRALSATVVWKGYKPIDFSKDGVLKSAMGLLVGQTINVDHETALGNSMGSVRSVSWQESYTDKGIKIPAGINAEFMIDGKANPRIARGINANPPYIHSNSVSVRFEWEPSHKMDSHQEFYSRLGSRDDKGNLYRLIVTKIIQFSETSLVAHGADAYAQIIIDGKINNPVYANSVYSFSAADTNGKPFKTTHVFDYKMDLSLNADPTTLDEFNNNDNHEEKLQSMKLLKILEGKLGLDEGTLTEENAGSSLDSFIATLTKEAKKGFKEEIKTLKAENKTLEEANADLKANESFKEEAGKYQANLKAERDSVKAMYNKLKGDQAEDAQLTVLDECAPEALETFKKEYQSALELKFPDTCKKCGTGEFISKSSSNGGDQGGSEKRTSAEVKASAKDNYYKNQSAKNKGIDLSKKENK